MRRGQLPYRQTILKQGLILVFIPFFVGTAILVSLYQRFQASEKLSAEERKQSEIVWCLNRVFTSWSSTSTSYLQLLAEDIGSPRTRTIAKQNAEVAQEMNKLERLTQDDRSKLSDLHRLSAIFSSECAEYTRCIPKPGDAVGTNSLVLMQKAPGMFSRIYRLRGEVRGLLDREWGDLQSARALQKTSRDAVEHFLYGATIFNIILGIALAWFFAAPMARRMRILIDQSESLHQGRVLERRLHGNDELDYLDSVMNDASRKLQQASEHRNSILSMVAHDMRSPIMSARANLQIMEEIGDDYSEQAVDELQSAYKDLSGVLHHAHELLELQKSERGITAAGGEPTEAEGSTRPAAVKSWPSRIVYPRLFQQSLLLVILPLLIQTTFLLLIGRELFTAEEITVAEQRCDDVVIYSNMILMEMVRGAIAQGIFLISKSPAMQSDAKKHFDEVTLDYDRLATVCGDDAEGLRYVSLAKQVSHQSIDKMLEADPNDINGSMNVFMNVGEVKEKSPQALRARVMEQSWFADNFKRLQEMSDRQRKLLDFISSIIGWSILSNFLIALYLLLNFTRRTNTRLTMLMQNAKRLAEVNKPSQASERPSSVLTAGAAADEIVELNMAIQRAEMQLRADSQRRAQIMNTLAQNMQAPLSASISHLDSFERTAGKALSEASKRHLSLAQQSIVRVRNLVADLLAIEQMEVGKIDLKCENFDLALLAEEAISTVSGLASNRNIELINQCSSIDVNADRVRLIQVLVNYLTNAIKFSSEHKSVTITSARHNGMVRVSVVDEGPGIENEDKNRVFEMFFQASGEHQSKGFGLGLAICKLIVESHGGLVGMESERGKGSTFWFEIPIGRSHNLPDQ